MTAARILVVDDNPINVELAVYVLGSDGFAVDSATCALDALERLASFRPDLVLMDIQMPGMDGLELSRRLKADPATRDIIIIALTAYAMKGDESKMLAAGCDGYLPKPLDVTTFGKSIRAFLAAGLRVDGSRAHELVDEELNKTSKTTKVGEL